MEKSTRRAIRIDATADEEYKARQKDIQRRLHQISMFLLSHSTEQAEEPRRWDFVGDLGFVVVQLDKIEEFLSSANDE